MKGISQISCMALHNVTCGVINRVLPKILNNVNPLSTVWYCLYFSLIKAG